jgi:hypothetical protein
VARLTHLHPLLLTLALACHGSARDTLHAPMRTVRWPPPDSSPQLQAYRYAWPAGVEPAPICRPREVVIDRDSIGPLRIGQRLPTILAQCPHVLVGWDWGDEAIPEPALMVRFGSATVLITLTDTSDTGTIYYLSTSDTSLHTLDGIRVGQPVTEVDKRVGPLKFLEGECGLYASSKRRPTLGIHLTLPADSLDCGKLVPKAHALPHGSRVAEIFLHSAT